MKKWLFLLVAAALTVPLVTCGAEATLTPTGDAPVFGYSPTSNYGSQTYGYWGYYNAAMRTLVQWNLSSVVGTVTSCKLSFYLMQNNWVAGTTIWACKLNGTWAESTVTWNTQPTHDTTTAGLLLNTTAPTGTGIKTLDCTPAANAIVQAWIASPATNYGVILRNQTEGGTDRAYPYMKESPYQPVQLIVTYTLSAVSPTSLGRVKAFYR